HWIIPLPFAVTGEQAAGLNGFLSEWFQAYEEYSIGDFVTQGVTSEEFDHENGRAYRVKCMTWLAPFDLGVSQRVAIETTPTDTQDVFDIHLIIDRESGDISNWKRVNRRFLNTLRKQFLIWRTLKQAERERYLLAAETASDEKKEANRASGIGGVEPSPAG
ncbi:MAG: ABC-type antimicrobial peptide transport system,permease component, partial [Chthonomonadaceae bacterium]|nr:ABC-type antimicrobial peptide transport system,permease component [Chthonomonadaceae bacterium]